MRKLVIAALFVLALGCFAGASVAYAGDCCKPKCHQNTCTKSCGSKCGSCKAKCDSCKPKCMPKCNTCKPKCETKCNTCKPKCDMGCKPKCNKCKQHTCTKSCAPKCQTKCNSCKPKCDMGCKPKCDMGCKPKCNKCKQHTCTKSCAPKCQNKCDSCKPKCGSCMSKCNTCPKPYKHPYEACWHGDPMLCDTGCCGGYMPCQRPCVTCETVCKAVEVCDPCNPCCKKVKYVYETVCHEVKRPRVIPWWFNEKGDGNIYLDDNDMDNDSGMNEDDNGDNGWGDDEDDD